jgi:hypothetical protein
MSSNPIPPFDNFELFNTIYGKVKNLVDNSGVEEYTVWDCLGIKKPQIEEPICVDSESYTDLVCRENPGHPMCREYDI